MTFESEGLLFVAIYIWLPPASYVVFLTTLVSMERCVRAAIIKDNSLLNGLTSRTTRHEAAVGFYGRN